MNNEYLQFLEVLQLIDFQEHFLLLQYLGYTGSPDKPSNCCDAIILLDDNRAFAYHRTLFENGKVIQVYKEKEIIRIYG